MYVCVCVCVEGGGGGGGVIKFRAPGDGIGEQKRKKNIYLKKQTLNRGDEKKNKIKQ